MDLDSLDLRANELDEVVSQPLPCSSVSLFGSASESVSGGAPASVGLVSLEEPARLVENLKAVLPVSIDPAVGEDTQSSSGIPPMSLSSPCSLVCGSVLRLSARPLVPGLVPVTRGLPPLVRPALIGLVVRVNHLALLGPVRRPSRSRTTTVSFSLFFIISMVYFSLFFLLMALTVISVNVNGLRDEHRRLGFLQWLSHLSASVVCLQETHAVSFADLQSWFSRFGFLCAGSFGSVHSCGVAVLYRPVFECKSVVCEFDGRFVLVELAFRGAVFRVASIYAPKRNPDRDDFFLFGVPMLVILLSLLFCAATSTRFLIVLLIVVVRVLLMFLVKVLQCCLACFRIVVLWISGGFGILVFLHFLGVGPMGPLPLASTSSVARMCGCPMCLLQTF